MTDRMAVARALVENLVASTDKNGMPVISGINSATTAVLTLFAPNGASEKRVKLSLIIEALESAANDARQKNISGFDALTGVVILLKRDP